MKPKVPFALIIALILFITDGLHSALARGLPEFFKIDPSAPALSVGVLKMRDTNLMLLGYITNIDAKKDYKDLSEADQSLWRQLYNEMPSDDQPPFPEGGLISILRPIAIASILEEDQGILIIHVEVDAEGNARNAEIFATPSPQLGKRVLEAALLTKYTAALCRGAPCVMTIPLRIILSHKNN